MKKRFLLAVLMGMLITVFAVGLGACKKGGGNGGGGGIIDNIFGEDPVTLSAPTNASYDGKTISWEAVPNATKYSVQINEGTTYSVTLPKQAYDAKEQTFNVTITAKGDGKQYLDAEPFTMTFSFLGKVEWQDPDPDGTLHWTALADATSYLVSVDGTEQSVLTPELSGLQPGAHNVRVRPVLDSDPSYYSSWSETKYVTILGQVQGSSITYKDDVIKWPSVANAAYYEVLIDGEPYDEQCSRTSIDYPSPEQSFTVSVRAIGDHTRTFDGAVSEGKNFIYLPTITQYDMNNGVMSWEPVDHATTYQIKTGGRITTVTEPKYDKIPAGTPTTISILPVCKEEVYFSAWSPEFNVEILMSPSLKWFADAVSGDTGVNNISWNEVTGAEGYTVYVVRPDGTDYTRTRGQHDVSFGADESYSQTGGSYTIQVKSNAPAGSGTVYDSLYSAPITVIRLAAPTASRNFITSTPGDLSQGFTVNFSTVAQASGYSLALDGTEGAKTSKTNSIHVDNLISTSETQERTINFSVSSTGSSNPAKNTYILDSQPSRALTGTVTILAMPQDVTINGKILSYGQIGRAAGYTVRVDNDAKVENDTTSDLNSRVSPGNHRVSVCANGNGAEILASNYTAEISVTRLFAPTNIHMITTEEDEGKLKFDCRSDQYAHGYTIYFEGSERTSAYDESTNMNREISLDGTTIHVIANADYFGDEAAVATYFMESPASETITFIRLAAPTFGAEPFKTASYNASQLEWNAPANISGKSVSITYMVYDADDVLWESRDGRSMDISDPQKYQGGQDYSFKVKAIGTSVISHTQYVNSEPSELISFWRLTTPTVTRQDGKYVWSEVPRADDYAVYVEGQYKPVVHESDGTYSYTPDFSGLEIYHVEIYAIGNNTTVEGATIINSAPKEYRQQTKQLTMPDFSFRYSSDAYTVDGTLTITITTESEHARGYSYFIDTRAQATRNPNTTYTVALAGAAGTYKIGVQACGGNFDEENPENEDSVLFYLDSAIQGSNDNRNYQLIILSTPSYDSINIERGGIITWKQIDDAINYKIELFVDGALVKTENTVGNTKSYEVPRDIYNANLNKKITFKLQALGNGRNIISSGVIEKDLTLK